MGTGSGTTIVFMGQELQVLHTDVCGVTVVRHDRCVKTLSDAIQDIINGKWTATCPFTGKEVAV